MTQFGGMVYACFHDQILNQKIIFHISKHKWCQVFSTFGKYVHAVKKLHVEQYKYLLFFLKGGGVAQIIALAGIIVGLMYNFVILHNFCNAGDV